MSRARNCCPESVICLYKIPLTWVKGPVSCLGVFPLDKHLDICLQKGLLFAFGEGLLICLLLKIQVYDLVLA